MIRDSRFGSSRTGILPPNYDSRFNDSRSTVKERQFPGIYIQEVFPILDSRITVHESDFQLKASFCFRIISLLCAVVRLRERRVNKKENDQAERVISTPELNMLPCLHPEPINVVVYHDPSGRSHLGIGLALRCFQHLSFPNIATQHCS